MRTLIALALVFCVACSSGGDVLDTQARVGVAAAASFGRVYVGEACRAAILVNSFGSGWLKVEAVEPADPVLTTDFSPDRASVAPGSTWTATLDWRPSAAGALATRVKITTDVEGAREWTVTVTGEARLLPDCDDHNDCTTDTFDRAAETCLHATHTNACDDGSACTVDDRCLDGVCRGVARTCNDDDVCTLNACDPAVGCVYPPDGRQCDDGDPCTTDVCDQDAGCSHPDAEAGTACGAFSCAVAHLCLFGTCRELDVTGSSDGFPCFDGDVCTEGDECLAGACNPGPLTHHAPRVEAVLPTFGGANSSVVSDGFRYLFLRDGAVDVTFSEAGTLRHVARLPLPGSQPRGVLLASGEFVIGDTAGLTLVVANTPETAHVAWTVPWSELGFEGTSWLPPSLVRVPRGVFVVLHRAVGDTVPGHAGLIVIVAGDEGPVALPAVIYEWPVHEEDLDADASLVVATGRQGAFMLDVGTVGAAATRLSGYASPPARVSVSGRRIAMLHAGLRIDLFEAAPPVEVPVTCVAGGDLQRSCVSIGAGCEQSGLAQGLYEACSPNGLSCGDPRARCVTVSWPGCQTCDCAEADSCCSGGSASVCMKSSVQDPPAILSIPITDATDVVLDGTLVAWSTPRGTFALDLSTGLSTPVRIDAMPGTRLDRGPSLLHVAGPLALSLLRTPGASISDIGAVTRITGPGHGDVTAVTDATAPEVSLGGPAITGGLDLLTKKFTGWHLSGAAGQNVIRGTSRLAIALSDLRDDGTQFEAPCTGVPIGIADAVAQVSVIAPCGLHTGHLAVAGATLWSLGDDSSDIRNSLPDRVIRAWSLAPYTGLPITTLPAGDDAGWTTLRGNDVGGGAVAGVFRPNGGLGSLTLSFLGLGPAGAVVRDTQQVEPTWFGDEPPSDLAASDGDLALLGNGGSLEVRTLGDSASDLRQSITRVEFPRADVDAPIRIPWMARGRAWLGFRETTQDALDSSQILTEALYETAGGSVVLTGDVKLSSPLVSAYDTGVYTVVATQSAVEIVAPACR